jgi:HD-like signal output (HDOD) protein/ActR/RegA family two-component response regulator
MPRLSITTANRFHADYWTVPDPARPRVLFVDDEPHLLAGLQNLLRKQRHAWDMVFAQGAEAALDELGKAEFDLIVSDMRMPGMDGAELLAIVKERHPSVARFVLSGQAEREALFRALPVAHQFLSKPCDAEVLRVAITRACRLQLLLRDAGIRQAIGRLGALPSAPSMYFELTQALASHTTGVAVIASIVERDPAMSAKMLQLVNSACFGLATRVTSIHDAAMYLGTETIRGLVLTSQVFAALNREPEGLSIEEFQRHSLMTARLAEQLVPTSKLASDAFAAGILHDVGQIVLWLSLHDRYAEIFRRARVDGQPLHQVELAELGVSHAEAGAYLLGAWGLPFPIVEAVAFHHSPGLVDAGDRHLLAAVHVADVVIEAGLEEQPPVEGIDTEFLEECGWTAAVPKAHAWSQRFLRENVPVPDDAGAYRPAYRRH